MSAFRAVPLGAVCLLYALAASAAPVVSSPLQSAVRVVWNTSPEVQAAQAELEAARARARAAAQPLYNPELSLDAENADVNRRTAGLSLALDLSGKRRARTDRGQAALHATEDS